MITFSFGQFRVWLLWASGGQRIDEIGFKAFGAGAMIEIAQVGKT